MRTLITIFIAAVAVCCAAPEIKAGLFSDCSPCDTILQEPCEPICGTKPNWEYGGWIETGLYVNQYGQRNAYDRGGFRPWSGNTIMLDNAKQSDLQMNQTWLYLGRQVDTRWGFDVGGRVDFVYGTDGASLQSTGLEAGKGWGSGDYYAAVAQLYGEVGFKDVNVKVGKFLTPMGYEDSQATERFFYSLGYTSAFLPNMHSGAIVTWEPNEKLSLFGGWITGESGFFNNPNDNAALLGGTIAPSEQIEIVYSVLVGHEKSVQEYFAQSLALTIKPLHRWEYTCEWTLRNDSNLRRAYWGGYGISNTLLYRANEKLAFGSRIEWMRVYDRVEMLDFPVGANGASLYGLTFGLNWTPNPYLLIRPEVRYDKVYGFRPFDRESSGEQFSAGTSAIVKF